MTKLFSDFMESYEYQKKAKSAFKKREMEFELGHETKKKKKGRTTLADLDKRTKKTISNNVMVTINGRDWKEMSVAQAKAAVATLQKKGNKR